MRAIVALFIVLATLLSLPLSAQGQVLSVETYVEEWDEAQQEWVRVDDGAHRFVAAEPMPLQQAIAHYGPFRVTDQDRAELVGVTDRASPRHFAAMLRDFPDLETLALIEAPGTDDDRANMQVGRMIRAAGLATHVPAGGSVRSGAVELFLAGDVRQIDDGAEFAVHSWMDEYGRQPQDFAMSAPENRMYLEYYRDMGMAAGAAREFYDMTNSVGHHDARWLTAQDMRGWLGQEASELETEMVVAEPTKIAASPQLAYLDLDTLLP